MAKEINSSAKCRGKLTAAVYHAYIDDAEKLKVYERWRDKKIQVVWCGRHSLCSDMQGITG